MSDLTPEIPGHDAADPSKLTEAKAALRRAEVQFRTLFEESPDAVVIIDPETTLPLDFNDAACRQVGYTREEYTRLRLSDLAVHRTPAEMLSRVAAVLKYGRAEFETVHRTRNGGTVDLWVTVRAIELGERQVLYTIRRDISEQKRAKAELELRESYFRALTELGSDLVAVLGADGALRYLSPSITRMLGYEPSAFTSRSALDFMHPDDQLMAWDTLQRVTLDEKSTMHLQVRVRHRDGGWRHLEIVGRNLLHDPSVAGVMLNARDVTERVQAENRIREQAALLDKARDAILVCDLESSILYWNQSAERVYGWTAREALGKNADQLLYASEADRPVSAFKGLIGQGDWSGELLQVDRSGQELNIESRWSLVRDDDGQPQSILIINTDVTETKKLQARVLRAQRMDSIGALAGGIAHDLNNVLSPILMAAELLGSKVTDPESQHWVATLSESARRAADIVRQILSFARGTGEELADVQLRHLITQHTRILRETFPRSIEIETAFDKDLWLVNGNATQLSQVLMNLSVNARDAMPNGGQIRIRARNCTLDHLAATSHPELEPRSYVAISVADTGCGIPRHLINRIFEPFFTTKDVTKGTGLGLVTAQGIVKSHGGTLTVWSEERLGTRFDIYLPAVHTEAALQVALQKTPPPRGSGQCVLVVDDEVTGREMLSATLHNHGYKILLAKDGADALEVLAAHPQRVDLILTDMAMPVMDGPSLIRTLRATRPELQIVALSGMIEALQPISGAGDIQLVEKPCTAEDLLWSVHRGLAGR